MIFSFFWQLLGSRWIGHAWEIWAHQCVSSDFHIFCAPCGIHCMCNKMKYTPLGWLPNHSQELSCIESHRHDDVDDHHDDVDDHHDDHPFTRGNPFLRSTMCMRAKPDCFARAALLRPNSCPAGHWSYNIQYVVYSKWFMLTISHSLWLVGNMVLRCYIKDLKKPWKNSPFEL